jgi:hypothetical protein
MPESQSRDVNHPLGIREPLRDQVQSERRRSIRKPIAMQVVIYERGLPVAATISRNVGLQGMYVETSWHPFSKGSLIEAEFAIADTPGGRRYRLPAVVLNVSKRGFGLTFNIFDQKLFRALEEILYGLEDGAQLGSRRIERSCGD